MVNTREQSPVAPFLRVAARGEAATQSEPFGFERRKRAGYGVGRQAELVELIWVNARQDFCRNLGTSLALLKQYAASRAGPNSAV